MRYHPNARHMAALFDFPPPFCPLPRTPVLADDLEFSDVGRDRAGWATILCVLAAIFVPLIAVVGVARGFASVWQHLVQHL